MSVQTILDSKGADVVTIAQDVAAEEAAWVMRQCNIGALVVKDGERVVGLLTQRDLANAMAEHGVEAAQLEVCVLMKRNFVRLAPGESTKRVMAIMTRQRATHIPVMDGEKLLGLVSIGDVVKDRLSDLELETNVLRDVYVAAH